MLVKKNEVVLKLTSMWRQISYRFNLKIFKLRSKICKESSLN